MRAITVEPKKPGTDKWEEVQEPDVRLKVHLMCGVKTNVVTAVEIGDRGAHDAQFLPSLVQTTAENFKIGEVSADKGYVSRQNAEAIEAVGAKAFIALKSNSTGGVGGGWEKLVNYFKYHLDEYLEHYHKRSNVETTFSMIKRKFGDALRSKTDVAMVNETLCKILCHNLVVLIHESLELGVDPKDWGIYPTPKKGPVSVPAQGPARVVVEENRAAI